MRRITPLFLGTVLLLAWPCAAADDEAQADAAEQYLHAKKLYNDGRYELALPLFREALERSGSPNARLFVARCLREVGDRVAAYEQFRKTLEDARELADGQPKYVPTRDAAAAELARLEDRIGRVVVALSDGDGEPVVTVAGRRVDDPREPNPVDPGTVIVEVTAEGYRPATEEVTVQAGALETVVVELEPLESATPRPDAPPASEDVDPGLGTWRTVGIVVAGVGVAGLVAGGVTGAMARSKESQLDEECGGQRCADPRYADVVDEGQTLATVANVGFFAGGALAAAGALMIIFGGPDDDPEASAALSPGLVVTPTGAWATMGGRF